MTIRTILVHADSDDRCSARVSLTREVAIRNGAKIHALFVRRPPTVPVMEGGYVAADIIEMQITGEEKRSEKVRAALEAMLGHNDVQWEWRSIEGPLPQTLAQASAVADLIVMGQDPSQDSSPAIAEVALTAGCPVLCVPHSGTFSHVGKRVLLAWNGSRESARALHDALPFITGAERVMLFAADEDADALATTMDAASRLAAHGAKVEVQRMTLADLDAGNAILNAAADTSSDLIVMGAYGHSRLTEWVFGGATRTILRSMTVPVLLAH